MTIRRACRHFLAVAACFAATSAVAQEKIPTPAFLDMVQEKMTKQCEVARAETLTASSDHDKGAAFAGVALGCDCMPREIKELGARQDLPAELTQDEALALIKPHFEHCTAQALREFLVSDCPTSGVREPGVKDLKAYCTCLGAGIAKLSDAEISNDAIASHEDFEARVAAERDGKPKPPAHKGSMEKLAEDCRAEQGAPPHP